MENNLATILKELSNSNYTLAPGIADISGWPVLNPDGQLIGTVTDLLFDPEAGQVRYLIISLSYYSASEFGKRIAVPIGLAERHPLDNAVVLPEVSAAHIDQLPAYTDPVRFSEVDELATRRSIEGHSTAPYEHPQFYTHQHFNEDRFYDTTDLTKETKQTTDARAERARRIVARFDHHEQTTNEKQQIPMEYTENIMEAINDLIKINNDRVAGFEKAATDLESDDNRQITVFNKLAAESRQYVVELTDITQRYGGEPAEGTSASGDLHRAWIDLKSAFTGSDLLAILNECERGEDAAKAAYRDALDPENELSPEVLLILQTQQQGITRGHDLIKSLRDQVETDENATDDDNDPYKAETETKDEPVYQEQQEQFTAQPSYESAAGEFGQQAHYVPEPESIEQEEEWGEEQEIPTGNSRLMEFFVNELKDLLWAERELVETLPDMADAATSEELKNAFEMHLSETETHVSRLEQIFGVLGLEPESRKCEAMAGIVDEGDEIIDATEEGTAQRDVGLIFAGQKAEHYEIASYGGMIALAKTLGYYEIAELLVLTLDEEKTADAKLTEIAEGQANYNASTERTDD
jgi:uncharacterized protein (TIGR02284 family)